MRSAHIIRNSEMVFMNRTMLLYLLISGLGVSACGRQGGSAKEEAKPAAPAAAADASPQLMSLLPAKNEVPGWAVTQPPRSFKAANLWEFIDGAADGYLAYGFQEVVSADYSQSSTGYQAVIDIYQMKDPLNAFGKYSEERNPAYRFLKVGNEGYSGGASLNFWSGPYYVKITAFDEKEPLMQELNKLAGAVAGKVTAPGAEPAEVSWFPKPDQLPRTVAYIPKDVLAQSYFTNGFEAKYSAAGKEYKLVLLTMESPSNAQDALRRYRQYVSTTGKEVKDLKAPGEGGFSGKDSFYGNMAAVRSGRNIAVALGVASEDAGRKLLAELIANIR